MKRLLILSLSILGLLTIVSCTKEVEGTLSEGIFQPKYKIQKITEGSNIISSWTWGTSKLASISDKENHCEMTFNYSGDMLGSVLFTYDNGNEDESIYYTYGGTLLTKVELVKGTTTMVTMIVNHNANDQISNINLEMSDSYLIALAMQQLGMGGKAITHLISPSAIDAITTLAKALPSKKGKYSIENKHFSITYTWENDNLVKEVLSGNITAEASLTDLGSAINMGPYLDMILNYINLDQEFPLSCTVHRETNYSYDDNPNPLLFFWGNGIDAQNLSRNNITNSIATGAADVTIVITIPDGIPLLGGTDYPYKQSFDLSGKTSYNYQYNNKHYPVSVTTDGHSYKYNYVK